ncbi:hypothetical protein TNCV_2284901 [Trichonephila clavipes]|nr:hypothetical protein TNCV_2284901 [Trichonephila clavipes]
MRALENIAIIGLMQKWSDLSDVQRGMIIGFQAKGGIIFETARTDHPYEPRGYQQCLPNYCSAIIAASGPLKQTSCSCTYTDCCSSAMKAGICTAVPQLDDHRVPKGNIFR